MKITDALRGEHAPLCDLLRHVDGEARALPTLEAVRAVAAVVVAALVPHARAEDELFFAPLLASGVDAGPLAYMHDEHLDIEGALQGAMVASDRATAVGHLLRAVSLALEHFEKEEEIVFPAADDALDEATLERYGADWARARRRY